jgi:hypothetical protein
VIVDFFIDLLLTLFGPAVDALPTHQPSFGQGSAVGWLAQADSIVPIAPALAAAGVMVAFLVAFVGFRMVLLVRHVLLP